MPTLSAYNLGQIWVDYIAPGLVDRTHRTTLEPKFQLVAQDDPQDRVYLVHSGKIKLTRISSVSRDTLLDILGPGDVFGANALTHGRPAQWFCAATTVEPVEISWVLLSDVRTYLSTRPEAELTLMRALAGKSIELYQDAVLMRDVDVPGRIATALVYMQRRFGQTTVHGTQLPRGLTQGEIAAMAGASRETVNKVLSDFVDRGWIMQQRRMLVILDPARLAARAQ